MAPPHTLRPHVRRPKSTGPNLTISSTSTENPAASSSFPTTKRDKRLMRHSSFLARIQKSSHVGTRVKKTRRPGKKLVTDLQSLGDALPEPVDAPDGEGRQDHQPVAIRLRKSLKSKPGATKKRDKVVRVEMERFERNLAGILALGSEEAIKGSAEVETREEGNVIGRWKALRAHLERGRDGGDSEVG